MGVDKTGIMMVDLNTSMHAISNGQVMGKRFQVDAMRRAKSAVLRRVFGFAAEEARPLGRGYIPREDVVRTIPIRDKQPGLV